MMMMVMTAMHPQLLTAALGQGKGGEDDDDTLRPPILRHADTDVDFQGFAPKGPSTLQSRIRDRLPQPLRIHARNDSISRIHLACSVCSSGLALSKSRRTDPTAEGCQFAIGACRQRALPRTFPLPHRRLAASWRERRPARIIDTRLCGRRTLRLARVQSRHDKPYRRRPDRHNGICLGMASPLVSPPADLQPGQDGVCGSGLRSRCIRRLWLHATSMAPVPETGGCRWRSRLGRQPASL